VLGLFSFVLLVPQVGTLVGKYVGVLIIVMSFRVLSALAGGCTDLFNN